MCYSTFAYDVAFSVSSCLCSFEENVFFNLSRMYMRYADMCGNEILPTTAKPSIIEIRPTTAVPSIIEIRPTTAVPIIIEILPTAAV